MMIIFLILTSCFSGKFLGYEDICKGRVELVEAIENGSKDEVIELIKTPRMAYVIENALLGDALKAALIKRNYDVLKVLIEAGLDINRSCIDEKGTTPLMYAVKMRDKKSVRILLGAGARTDITDEDGHRAVVVLSWQKGSNISIVQATDDPLRFNIDGIRFDGFCQDTNKDYKDRDYIIVYKDTELQVIGH